MIKKYILVIEDDLALQNVMRDVLMSEGFTAHVARNGKHAFEVISKEGDPALIFLDIMMPIMNGHEFLKLFRAEGVNAHVPVIVMSANTQEADVIGATHFLKKPASLENVLSLAQKYFS